MQGNLPKARSHLHKASQQLEKAQVYSWGPEEPAECVSAAFYSYENAVVAAAEALGLPWKTNHYDKAEVAARLSREKNLKTDVSDLLLDLNGLRKDVSYGEPGEELSQYDLEGLVTNLENFIGEVDNLGTELEEEEETEEHAPEGKTEQGE